MQGTTWTDESKILQDNVPVQPGMARFMIAGIFYSCLGWRRCHLIACEDIGIFAAKALLEPENQTFANQTIDLSSGEYGLEEYSQAIEATQNHVPWFARYFTRGIRNVLPYDFKQMMICECTKCSLES